MNNRSTKCYLFMMMGLVGLLFFSCQNAAVLVDTNESIEQLKWSYFDKVRTTVKIDDVQAKYALCLNLRHTGDYKYSNIFILIHQIGPGGKRITERREFKLALPDGEWLGKGSGSLYSHQICFRKDYQFPNKGNYVFELEQNMRDNPLREISDVGLRIEKQIN